MGQTQKPTGGSKIASDRMRHDSTTPQGKEGRSLQPGNTDLDQGPVGNKTQGRDQA